MEPLNEEIAAFQQFLEEFCENHHGPVSQKDGLPFRLTTCYLTEAEAEGECLDWALHYLNTNGCPWFLALALAHAAVAKVLEDDWTPYIADQPPCWERESDCDTSSKSTAPTQLDAENFGCLVLTRVHDVAHAWRQSLPPLPLPKQRYEVSVCAIKNTRRKMEDKHVLIHSLNLLNGWKDQPDQAYFAVFDGHGGLDAANYAAAHLHCSLARHEAFHTDVETALRDSFRTIDKKFVEKASRENLHSGSTGVCCVLREKQLHVAWLGDSQVLLVRDGQPVHLMEPHKPEREDERRRIEELGGCVVFFGAWRVNGTLSVSRAIGDPEHKKYVIGEPDVMTTNLDGSEDYIVVACDGLWDTVTPETLITTVHEHLQDPLGDKSTVAQKLVKTARDTGSGDNISVIVIFLRNNIAAPKLSKTDKSVEISATPDDDTKEGDEEEEEKKDEEKLTGSEEQGSSSPESERRLSPSDSQQGSNQAVSGVSPASGASPRSAGLQISSQELETSSPASYHSQSASQKVIISSGQSHGDSSRSPFLVSSHSTTQSAEKSDVQSSTSGTDLALMSKTATRCVNNRKAKRSKAGRNGTHLIKNGNGKNGKNLHPHGHGHTKENRGGGARSKTLGPFPPRTLYRTPIRSRSTESNLGQLQRTLIKNSDQMLQMLTGWSPQVIRKAKAPSKWTVAVEVDASAMFADRSPVTPEPQPGLRKFSDTPEYKGKK